MSTHFSRDLAILVTAVLLSSIMGASAQTPPNVASGQNSQMPPSSMAPMPPPGENGGAENRTDWKNEKFERQELREEMEQIRRDHEDLESARDQMMEKCGGSDPLPPECEQQKQVLRDRHEQLHERTLALREKIQSARRDHPEGYSMQHSNWPPENRGPDQLRGKLPAPPQAAAGQAQQPAPPPPR